MFRRLARRVLDRARKHEDPRQAEPVAPPAPTSASVPPPAETLANIDSGAQEVVERVGAGEPVVLLDVREARGRAGRIIPGARLIPLSELEARWREVEDCDEIVCYAREPAQSMKAARLLRGHGVFNATSLDGGLASWVAFGGPLAEPES